MLKSLNKAEEANETYITRYCAHEYLPPVQHLQMGDGARAFDISPAEEFLRFLAAETSVEGLDGAASGA